MQSSTLKWKEALYLHCPDSHICTSRCSRCFSQVQRVNSDRNGDASVLSDSFVKTRQVRRSYHGDVAYNPHPFRLGLIQAIIITPFFMYFLQDVREATEVPENLSRQGVQRDRDIGSRSRRFRKQRKRKSFNFAYW